MWPVSPRDDGIWLAGSSTRQLQPRILRDLRPTSIRQHLGNCRHNYDNDNNNEKPLSRFTLPIIMPRPAALCLFVRLSVARPYLRTVYSTVYYFLSFTFQSTITPQREWADPGGTAIPGQPVGKSEQAPASSPSAKNQFNIDVPRWGTYQILS